MNKLEKFIKTIRERYLSKDQYAPIPQTEWQPLIHDGYEIKPDSLLRAFVYYKAIVTCYEFRGEDIYDLNDHLNWGCAVKVAGGMKFTWDKIQILQLKAKRHGSEEESKKTD